MSDELKPCPFCGHPAATAGKKATRFPWFKKVTCSNDGCGAHFAYWHPDEWSRRADRPAQTEQQPDIKPGDPHAQIVTAGGKRSDQDYVVVRRSLLEAIEACEWRGEMAASSGNELRAVMAGRTTYGLYAAPIAQTAPAQVTAAMWKAAHDSMESDGDLALALQEALNAAHGQTAPQPEQSGLVESASAVIRAADWWSANEDSPKSALTHFVRAANSLRDALSAQGGE